MENLITTITPRRKTRTTTRTTFVAIGHPEASPPGNGCKNLPYFGFGDMATLSSLCRPRPRFECVNA